MKPYITKYQTGLTNEPKGSDKTNYHGVGTTEQMYFMLIQHEAIKNHILRHRQHCIYSSPLR